MITLFCFLAYLSGWGISAGYILATMYDRPGGDEFAAIFGACIIWPAVLPMYVFYNLFKDAEKEARKR